MAVQVVASAQDGRLWLVELDGDRGVVVDPAGKRATPPLDMSRLRDLGWAWLKKPVGVAGDGGGEETKAAVDDAAVQARVDAGRDDLRAAEAALVDRVEQEWADEFTRFYARQLPVILARLRGPKVLRHTRHWDPPGDRKLDAALAVQADRWQRDLTVDVERLILHTVRDQDTKALGGFLGRRAEQVVGWLMDRVSDVQYLLTTADEGGDSIDILAGKLSAWYGDGPKWARAVARGNAAPAINEGRLRGEAAGAGTVKEWLSRRDERVRPSHRLADGQRAPMDGHFQVGPAQLAYPGDLDGPPAETANCRCTVLVVAV